jgi:cytochrome c biogenesis protein CcdA
MKLFHSIQFIIIGILILSISISSNSNSKIFAEELDEITIHFFYSKDCDTCKKVLMDINDLIKEKNLNVNLIKYELTENTENLDLLFFLLDSYGYQNLDYDIPVVFIGNQFFAGESSFDINFKPTLISYLDNNDFYDETEDIINRYYNEAPQPTEKTYIKVPAVIVSALIDSINPCAIGVIVLLVTTLIASKNRRYALMSGIIYIFTIFVVYLLLGLGFIYLARTIQIPHIFFIIIGAILIILGILSIKDFFWYGKGFSLGIPKPITNIIEKNIYKATIASIIFIGILISIFEATCSGAIYLGILSIISKQGLSAYSLFLLLLYNFIFILPLLVILLVFYFGIPAKKIKRLFIQKRRRIYRLILGIILVFLGIYLIIWM